MTRALLSVLVLLGASCATVRVEVPEALARGATRFDLQQLQLFPKSGKPIEQLETGRWSTHTVMRSGEESFSRAGRAMVRGKVEYVVGRRNEETWSVKCDVSRPVGDEPVPPEAASASVLFCAHTPLAEKVRPFELRLSLQHEAGDAGLVRIEDEFLTIEPFHATREGVRLPGPAGWALRDKGVLVAAVVTRGPRAFIVAESVSGWRVDVLAAAALAIVASGEPSIDAVRPWVDPGGSF